MNKIKKLTILSFILFFVFFYIINDQNKPSTYSFAQTASTNITKETIPSYAVDQFGNKTAKFPLYSLTNDKKTEMGLSWNPPTIKTNEPITFLMDFFSSPQNEPLHLWPYNFILIQNGKEIYRTNGHTEMGSSTEKYTFSNPGNLSIKIESSQDPRSVIEYNTIVYKNPNSLASSTGNNNMQNMPKSSGLINSLTLVYSVYAIIIGLPIALVIIVILIKKGII